MYLARKYEANQTREHWRALAFAYLDASEQLCQDMVNGSWPPSYEHGQPALWLAFHATEVFLKACISPISSKQIDNLHSLGELLLAFNAKYPDLDFDPPFGSEPMPADPSIMEAAIKHDASLHQQLRYPVDNKNRPWPPAERGFSPTLFLAELKRLRSDFVRLSDGVFL